ncbi:MAG: FAD-linked oxidase C-terminal domain-containing protein [Myxococcota bacterium]
MTRSWTLGLAERLGPGRLVVDGDILSAHARDHAQFAESGAAAALVRAREVEDVVTTLRFASRHRIPVVTRGAGTGLAGGANAQDGCILLSLAAMNRILELDLAGRTATVEAGVLNGTLAAAAREEGLFYAPDPASRDISTIGGNVATNAGGACCLKYGVTRDHVLALTAVTADGEIIQTGGKSRKNVAGLDLTRLLVGSEGTLAVVVEATVRLLPAPPPASTLVAFFDDLSGGGRGIQSMLAREHLSLVEVMDRTTVRAVEAMAPMELDTSAACMVLVQSDAESSDAVMQRCEGLATRAGASAVFHTDDPDEGKMLLKARSLALPALERMGSAFLDDVAAPVSALVELLEVCEGAGRRHDVTVGTFGHAGDGNLHPTLVFEPGNARAEARARAAFDDIVEGALALGGTVSGEHGVGSLKRPYLDRMIGRRERALMRGVKAAFDPEGILNPGRGF